MFFKNKPKVPDDPPVCLLTDADTLELGLITRLFKEQGLPFLSKEHQSVGGIFRIAAGFSPFGMEVWVKCSDLERAKELLDSVSFRAEEDEADGEESVCLVSFANAEEQGTVESLLKEEGVPFMTRDAESSGAAMRVLSGGSIYGMDIYVRPADLEKARDLLESSGFRGTAAEGPPDGTE